MTHESSAAKLKTFLEKCLCGQYFEEIIDFRNNKGIELACFSWTTDCSVNNIITFVSINVEIDSEMSQAWNDNGFRSRIWSQLKSKAEKVASKFERDAVNQNSKIIMVTPFGKKMSMEKDIPKSKEKLNGSNGHGRDEQSHVNESNNRTTETDHYKNYEKVWKIIDFLAWPAGVDIRKGREINFRLILAIFCVITVNVAPIYTIFLARNDIKLIIEAAAVFGAAIPATHRIIMANTERTQFLSPSLFMEKILKSSASGSRQAYILKKELHNILKKTRIYTVTFFLSFAVFGVYPCYAFVFEGKLEPLLRMEFPYVDQTELKGYLIGFVIFSCIAVLGSFGSVGFDLYLASAIFNYAAMVELLEEDLKEFHRMWKNKDKYCRQDLDFFIKRFCMKYEDVNSYVRYLSNFFGSLLFRTVGALYSCLVFAVYASLHNGWISGYGFCLYSFLQLYMMCYLGTYVEIQNERLNKVIYFSPWYEYPVSIQKIFLMLIHRSNFNTTTLKIGPIAPLNVETGRKMTSNIYSYNAALASM